MNCRRCNHQADNKSAGYSEFHDGTVLCSYACENAELKEELAVLQAEHHRVLRIAEPLVGARDIELENLKRRVGEAYKKLSDHRLASAAELAALRAELAEARERIRQLEAGTDTRYLNTIKVEK